GQRGKVNQVEGLGGGFRFCALGPTLFDARGQIRPDVAFEELAQHIFFTETGEPLPAASSGPLLGVVNGVGVYLLYNGILGDKSEDGGNVLTRAILASLPAHDGPKVVYGHGCTLSRAALQQKQITFRQIPYEVKVS
ncbi:MAG: site-specific DNA-methyltransferase, partial [Anaerolineae bacterium]